MSNTLLIVGASSDVGYELINTINKTYSDTTILAHYRSSFDLDSINLLNGNHIETIQADISNSEGVENLLSQISKLGIIPNAIVHLAAPKLGMEKFDKIPWKECESDAFVQVGSIYMILQALLPKMIKNPGMSKVVLALSENTVNLPARFTAKYTMSKYMLLGLMKSLTSDYRDKRININAISPSMIDTKLLSNIDRRMLEVSGITDNILTPKDVVPKIMRLLSSESDMMFGENILIPGKEI